jgi:protein O-mannosyl-transferase
VIVWSLAATGFHGDTTGFAVRRFTSWSYLLTQPGVLAHYLRLVFWPTGLCLDYGWPPAQGIGEVVFPGLLVVGLLALTVWGLVKRPAWGFLGAWFFVILAPTSSFVPIQDAAFEHRLYLPLAAVATAVVAGVFLAGQRLVRRGAISLPASRIAGSCLAISVVAALAIRTWQRNEDYRSEFSIWADTVAKAPDNGRPHYNLGKFLAQRGQVDEAILHYRRALEIEPDDVDTRNNLGNVLAGRGQVDEAIVHFQKALEIEPDDAKTHNNLGIVLAGRGQADEAVVHFRKALEIEPDDAIGHNNLGIVLAGRGKADEAIAQYRKALKIKPDYAKAHNNLGNALAGSGQVDEAILHFQKALEIEPDVADIHNSLGVALQSRGRFKEAVAHCRRAMAIRPQYVPAQNALAWMLATCPEASVRNGAEAVEVAQRAARLSDSRDPAILDTLAAAYAEAGRFSEAIETARRALDLATEQNNGILANTIRARLKLYQSNTPYRQTQNKEQGINPFR